MLSLLPFSLLLASSQFLLPVVAIDCKKIKVDGIQWDINSLSGDYEVYEYDEERPGGPTNTTYAFNLCKPIKRHDDKEKRSGCPPGAWACGFSETKDEDDKKKENIESWPIAGNFEVHGHGAPLDDHQSRLKNSKSNEDAQKDLEGLILEYNGGKSRSIKDETAMMIMELRCKRDGDKEERDDEDKKKEKDGPRLISYKVETKSGSQSTQEVLRLQWDTPHACEDDEGSSDEGQKSKGGWGFFTWLIIVLFLIVAAYLIFGSWLNYSRHGARGWDLLPHGDMIRDIPYLLKDWGRRVVDTVKGDSRGGYNQI